MLLNLCRFAFGKINKLFLIMGGVWYLTGCTLTAEVNSLLIPPVAVESHRILEVSTDSVIVELSGRCPENVKVIKIDLDGRILQIVNEKSSGEELTGLTPGEFRPIVRKTEASLSVTPSTNQIFNLTSSMRSRLFQTKGLRNQWTIL